MLAKPTVFGLLIVAIALGGLSISLVTAQQEPVVSAPSENSFDAKSHTPIYKESLAAMPVKVDVINNVPADPSIVLEVETAPDTVSFIAANTGEKPMDLDVNKWILEIRNEEGFSLPAERELVESNMTLDAGSSVVIKSFDLAHHAELFETHPSKYTFDLRGMRWDDELYGNAIAYRLAADITFGYDESNILSHPTKLLKADGVQMVVQGEGDPFTVEGAGEKTVEFYLYNDQDVRISSLVKGFDLLIWNTDNRTRADGGTAIIETLGEPCEYLEPGEKVHVATYDFSNDSWPLGANGISKKYGSETAVPGLYIANLQVIVQPCALESGETIQGGVKSLVSAFGVKP